MRLSLDVSVSGLPSRAISSGFSCLLAHARALFTRSIFLITAVWLVRWKISNAPVSPPLTTPPPPPARDVDAVTVVLLIAGQLSRREFTSSSRAGRKEQRIQPNQKRKLWRHRRGVRTEHGAF